MQINRTGRGSASALTLDLAMVATRRDRLKRFGSLPELARGCICGAVSMDIKAVAAASGLSVRMIRHYEKRELIGPVQRSSAGDRIYSLRHVHIFDFIRRLRDLGFSVAEISDFLALWLDRSRACADVKVHAFSHIRALTTKAAALGAVVDVLIDLIGSCERGDRKDYPILKTPSDQLQPGSSQSDLRFIGHGH